jgi:hypothetical protein
MKPNGESFSREELFSLPFPTTLSEMFDASCDLLFHSPFLSFILFQLIPFIFLFIIVFSSGELSFRILLFCWSLQKYVLAVVPKRYHFLLFIIFRFLRGWFIVIVGLTIIDLVHLVHEGLVALRGQIGGMLFYLRPDLLAFYMGENTMEFNGIDVIIGGTLEMINPAEAEPPDDPSTPSAPPRPASETPPPEILSPPLSPTKVPRRFARFVTSEHTDEILNRGFLWGVQGHTPNIIFVDQTTCPASHFLPTLSSSELENLYQDGERRCLGEGVYAGFVWHHLQDALELEMLARIYGPNPGPIT